METGSLFYDKIDTRLFKAFMAAADTGSFTHGAIQAGMTQSGMSQHISKLEEQIGVSLFERVNKKVILTAAGHRLREFVETSSESMSEFVEKLTRDRIQPEGTVRYAMPAFCLKTPHFQMLLEKRSENFPLIRLQVNLWDNAAIHGNLLEGNIDFGFVTKKENNPALHYIPFAEEEYIFVAQEKKTADTLSKKNVGELPYIDYPGFGTVFQIWREHFFPQKELVGEYTVPLFGFMNNLDGAITMVRHGMGASVFPRHCVSEFLKTKELHEFRSPTRNPRGTISIVTRKQGEPSRRVQLVIDAFLEMKK